MCPLMYYWGLEQTEKEYPPYTQYPLGVSWVTTLAVLNTLAAVRYATPKVDYRSEPKPVSESKTTSKSKMTSGPRTTSGPKTTSEPKYVSETKASGHKASGPKALGSKASEPRATGPRVGFRWRGWPSDVMMGMVLAIGLMPYVALRTYPAFAMFSNLRIEARSNHWFIPDWQSWLPFEYTKPVRVYQTNLRNLETFQVNLAHYYPTSTLSALSEANIEPALWICPPNWPFDNPDSARPYSIPKFELQRAVSRAIMKEKNFFVEYDIYGKRERFECNVGGCEGDNSLKKPLTIWQKAIMRFRSFDPDDDTCRH
ncbi:hypothetical protein AAMO2058_001655900 [Amorphochlora amoebiformis]